MSSALRYLDESRIKYYTVAAGQAVTLGWQVILASDTTVQNSGAASDAGIGIALESAVAGAPAKIHLYGHVVPVVVGTGGATRGAKAIFVADGFTNAAAAAAGATTTPIAGVFLQSGVATNRVGMMLALGGNRESA